MSIFGNKPVGKRVAPTKKFDENKLKTEYYRLSKSNVKHVQYHRQSADTDIFSNAEPRRTPSTNISELRPHNGSRVAPKPPLNGRRLAEPPKRKKKSKFSKALAAMLSVVIIIVCAVYVGSKLLIAPPKIEDPPITPSHETDKDGQTVTPTGEDSNSDETYIDVNGAEGFTRKNGYYTILVACTDEGKTRTDSIVFCSFDSVNDKINVLNIPRDTMSNVSRNVRKINSSYSVGKVKQLKKEINMLLGVPVDRYVIFDFDGIADVVDALGGITFDVPVKMNYDDPTQNLHIHFDKGEQLLSGKDVVKVLRFRKNNNGSGYPNADIGRIATLQSFAKTLAAKLTSSPAMIAKVPSVAQAALKNTTTDLTVSDVGWFVSEGLGMSAESIELFTLPGYNKSVYEPSIGINQSYWIPKASEIITLVNESFNPYEEDISKINVVTAANISRGAAPTTSSGNSSSSTKNNTSTPSGSKDVPVIATSSIDISATTSTKSPSETKETKSTEQTDVEADSALPTSIQTDDGDTLKNSKASENPDETTESTSEPTEAPEETASGTTETVPKETTPTESESSVTQTPIIESSETKTATNSTVEATENTTAPTEPKPTETIKNTDASVEPEPAETEPQSPVI